MDPTFLQSKHAAAVPYDRYLATGKLDQQENWRRVYEQTQLTAGQHELLGGFTRRINVLCVSGIWCGDCVQQGPLLQRIAEAGPARIDLRWLDRDEHPDLARQVMVNGGNRVPVVLFLAEDFELVGWFGDRTLSRYRAIARRQLGPACPLPGAALAPDELAATLQDWVDQFERVHLLLRISPRLRGQHED